MISSPFVWDVGTNTPDGAGSTVAKVGTGAAENAATAKCCTRNERVLHCKKIESNGSKGRKDGCFASAFASQIEYY